MRKAFTLVELLATLLIVGVLAFLIVSGCGMIRSKTESKTEIFQCVKSYIVTTNGGHNHEFHVNLRLPKSSNIETFIVDNEGVFANFEEKEYYEVEHYNFLSSKYIRSARHIPAIVAENGELQSNK